MSTNQTTYLDTLAVAYPGMVANGETSDRISRTCEDSGGLGFGKAAYQGAGDHGVTGTQTLAGASAALGTNTGNGVMGAVTVAAGARLGTYGLVIIEPATNAGAFSVTDPVGKVVGHGTVGVAFNAGGLSFTLADGSTDFVSGDSFSISVTGNAFLGVTIAHEALAGILAGQTADKYQQYDNVAILARGTIFVTASSGVTPRAAAFADTSGDFATSGAPSGGFEFDVTGSSADVVKIVKR